MVRVVFVAAALAVALAVAATLASCGRNAAAGPPSDGRIAVVAAENQYGSVASQVGGGSSTSPRWRAIRTPIPIVRGQRPEWPRWSSSAQVVIENGIGYDDYMYKIESPPRPIRTRDVLDVQHLLGLPDDTPNPHLWYSPKTMPSGGRRGGRRPRPLRSRPTPPTSSRNAAGFIASLQPWLAAIAQFRLGPRRDTGRHHRAGRRLHAGGGRHRQPHALHPPGRHHERRRSLAPGRGLPGRAVRAAPGEGVRLQPAGHRHAHRRLHRRRAGGPASRWSACTRRCRRRATTTSRGCWPRRAPSSGRSSTTSRRPAARDRPRRLAPARAPILALDGVGVSLSGRQDPQRRQLQFRAGEFTGLIGSNGAGKTTLFRVILGLHPTDDGYGAGGGPAPVQTESARSVTCRRRSASIPTCPSGPGTWWAWASTVTASACRCRRPAGRRWSTRCWRRSTPPDSPTPGWAASRGASSSG